MLAAIIVILLCLNVFLLYQWGVTAVREYKRGFEGGVWAYQEKAREFAEAHPTLTAEELYETIKIEMTDEESRQN